MTGKQGHHDHRNHDGDQERLARLYREQGDIEPGPGVDQRIRASARNRVRPSGLPRPAHWLGGAAVAASLFVVVSIVTRIEPPEPQFPVSEPTRTDAETGAGDSQAMTTERPARGVAEPPSPAAEAPELATPQADRADSADLAPRSAGVAARRAEAEADAIEERALSNEPAPPPDPDTMLQRRTRWAAADEAAHTAREQYQAVGEFEAPAELDLQAEKSLELSAESDLDLPDEETADARRLLWLIEQMISIGNTERARARIEEFRERFPEREVPPELLAQLRQLEDRPRPD